MTSPHPTAYYPEPVNMLFSMEKETLQIHFHIFFRYSFSYTDTNETCYFVQLVYANIKKTKREEK
jgi:hypothetical protein